MGKGVVRLCGARSSNHGPNTLVPEVFLYFFFFRGRESEPRSGDNEEKISELWKIETRVGSEGKERRNGTTAMIRRLQSFPIFKLNYIVVNFSKSLSPRKLY